MRDKLQPRYLRSKSCAQTISANVLKIAIMVIHWAMYFLLLFIISDCSCMIHWLRRRWGVKCPKSNDLFQDHALVMLSSVVLQILQISFGFSLLKKNLKLTTTVKKAIASSPIPLVALHWYSPESVFFIVFITRTPSCAFKRLELCLFDQVISGSGFPLALHTRRTSCVSFTVCWVCVLITLGGSAKVDKFCLKLTKFSSCTFIIHILPSRSLWREFSFLTTPFCWLRNSICWISHEKSYMSCTHCSEN